MMKMTSSVRASAVVRVRSATRRVTGARWVSMMRKAAKEGNATSNSTDNETYFPLRTLKDENKSEFISRADKDSNDSANMEEVNTGVTLIPRMANGR